MTITPVRTVIEGNRNRSRHQGQNSSCYRRSQRIDHAVIEIRMTCTVNEAFPGKYTLKEEGRRGEGKIPQKEDFPSNRE